CTWCTPLATRTPCTNCPTPPPTWTRMPTWTPCPNCTPPPRPSCPPGTICGTPPATRTPCPNCTPVPVPRRDLQIRPGVQFGHPGPDGAAYYHQALINHFQADTPVDVMP